MSKYFPRSSDSRSFGLTLAFGLAALLAGAAARGQESGERYVVDAAHSDFHWLVYKAGAFSRFGHNHTIAAGDLSGSVLVNANDLAQSQFDLQFGVAKLVVDD